MEQRKIRRVSIADAEPRDVWLRVRANTEWIQFDTLLGRWSGSRSVWSPRLFYWGGLAGVVGGVLWIVLILVPQLNYAAQEYRVYPVLNYDLITFIDAITLYLNPNLLVLPLLLFLVGSLGLFAWQWQTPRRLGNKGFFLAAVGLILTITNTLNSRWLQDLHTYIVGYDLNSLFFAPPPPFRLWLGQTWFGFLIACLGLGLLGLPFLRARARSRSLALLIEIAPVVLFLAPIICVALGLLIPLALRQVGYERGNTLETLDPFTIMALMFGASWIWLGRKLMSERSKGAIQPGARV